MVSENGGRRWAITPAIKQQVIERLLELIEGDDAPVAVRASRLLIQMDAQNAKDGHGDDDGLRQQIQRMMKQRNN